MPVPHQPPNNLPLASSLPKVSFRRIPEHEVKVLAVPAGVQDQQLVNYGFNDGTEFERPEHYLRYVEPIESELSKQVEYDMDEQDQEWLDALNADRRREQMDIVSYEAFEIIVDRLEKEWFDLMKRVPSKALPVVVGPNGEPVADSSEDIECAICDDGECENSNAIVFCDGCNLAVHQDCYGIPYIPEGQWLCRKCTVSPDRAVSCVLCPHEGGAFKQTTQGKWAHLLCAMWIPETGVSNPVYMEPIDSVERIPKARWKLQCYICRRRVGACIQCDNKNCFTAFHVTCARRSGLLLKTQRQRVAHTPDGDNEESGEQLRAWCHKHLPKSIRAQRSRREEYQDAHSQPPSPTLDPIDKKKGGPNTVVTPARRKSARAYKKSYRPSLSLVPAFVVNRVADYIVRLHVRKKLQLVMQIARFWSLKREARRGAPLLKRLHLEPWTANTTKKEQSDAERLKKLRFLLHLREDLEKVRMLAELVRKREKEKQRQAQVIRSALVENLLFPYNADLRSAFDRIVALDRSSLFMNPVSVQVVPDYYDIVKKPMDWTSIACKLDDLCYTNVQDFKDDVLLVLENAMLYNKIDTAYHRTAARILHVAGPIFTDLDRALAVHGQDTSLNLEPERDIVNLLLESATRSDDEDDRVDARSDAADRITHQSYRQSPKVVSAKARVSITAGDVEKKKVGRLPGRQQTSKHGSESVKSAATSNGFSDSASKLMVSERARRTSAAQHSWTGPPDVGDADLKDRYQKDSAEPQDLEVGQVNSWDSFKRFNVGWVLPEGVKRSRNKPQMDLIGQLNASLTRSQSAATSIDGQSSVLSTGDAMGRKRKHSEEAGPSANTSGLKRSRSLSNAQQSNVLHDEEQEAEKPRRRIARGDFNLGVSMATTAPDKGHAATRRGSLRGEQAYSSPSFDVNTLCWAKVGGYPHFPAEVYGEDAEDVPKSVLKSKPNATTGKSRLVRFFDAKRTFGWVMESRLYLLFEDDELDERMLRAVRTPKQRKDLRQSFDRARAQAE